MEEKMERERVKSARFYDKVKKRRRKCDCGKGKARNGRLVRSRPSYRLFFPFPALTYCEGTGRTAAGELLLGEGTVAGKLINGGKCTTNVGVRASFVCSRCFTGNICWTAASAQDVDTLPWTDLRGVLRLQSFPGRIT